MKHALPHLIATLAAAAIALPAVAGPEAACGSLEWNYGPYDYRLTTPQQRKIVEARHMNAERFGISIEDLEYLLNVYPNHPMGLAMMTERAKRAKSNQAPRSKRTVDCWYERALRFKPADHIPRLLYVNFLIESSRPEEARKHLEYAAESTRDDAFAQFNVGMLYADMKDYDKALEQAHRVMALGFERRELRDRLTAAGRWVEPAASTAAEPASAASR